MNGVIATSMREKGLHYRMNFGVDIPKIKEIAKRYESGSTLAEVLWKEDVREMKILATMLYPSASLTKESADRWVMAISNQEIREQACRNLFQEVAFADELVNDWTKNEDEKIRTTGYWLFARLCIIRSVVVTRIEINQLLGDAVNDLKSESLLLCQSALNALKFYGRISQDKAENVLKKVASFENSGNLQEKEMLDQLLFEFGYAD
ncbi:MAG: DNA alkylation repair protein [Proteiniphilum sp.]|nr:DNA alkylation repair protein [Proteiniphilum sp.]